MRRSTGMRVLMALAGVAMFVVYGTAAYLGYRGLWFVWQRRPDPATTVVVVLAVTLTLGYVSYKLGIARILQAIDAHELPRHRAPELYRRVDALAAAVGIEPPTVLISHMDAPNALAIGGPTNGHVILDASLFRLLSGRELEAILAHEFAHLENRDGLVQTLGYSLVQTVAGLLMLALLPVMLLTVGFVRGVAYVRGEPLARIDQLSHVARAAVASVAVLLLFVLTLALRAHSRRRELVADDVAADLTDPRALASALRKIQRAHDPHGLLSPLFIHGDEEGTLTRLLATHPPMDRRIGRLRERAQGQAKRIPVR